MSTNIARYLALPISLLSFTACDPLARGPSGVPEDVVEPGAMVTEPRPLLPENPDAVGPGSIVGGAVVSEMLPLCPDSDITQPAMTGRSLAVDPTNRDNVFVGVEGRGFFRTRDGGLTWKRAINGMKAGYVDATAQLCFGRFTTTAVDPRDGNHLCVAVRGASGTTASPHNAANGIYCSRDGGTRWSHRTPLTLNTAVNALAIDHDTSDQLYAGLSAARAADGSYPVRTGVVATSWDDGRAWYEMEMGMPVNAGMEVSDLIMTPSWPRRLYAGVPIVTSPTPLHAYDGPQLGLLSSADGGLTWSRLDNGMSATRNADRAITRVAASPWNPNRMLLATGNVAPAPGPYVYRTADAGGVFAPPSSPADLALDTFAFDPSDVSGRHALGLHSRSDTLWETVDGGDTWIDLGAILPSDANNRPVRLSHLVWSPDPEVLYLAGSHAAVYKSTDGGRTWSKILTEDMLPPDEVVK